MRTRAVRVAALTAVVLAFAGCGGADDPALETKSVPSEVTAEPILSEHRIDSDGDGDADIYDPDPADATVRNESRVPPRR